MPAVGVMAVGTSAILTTLAALIVLPIIAAILSVLILKRLAYKIIAVAICASVFIILWAQRQELSDCAKDVKTAVATQGLQARAECQFLWWDLKVNLPSDIGL